MGNSGSTNNGSKTKPSPENIRRNIQEILKNSRLDPVYKLNSDLGDSTIGMSTGGYSSSFSLDLNDTDNGNVNTRYSKYSMLGGGDSSDQSGSGCGAPYVAGSDTYSATSPMNTEQQNIVGGACGDTVSTQYSATSPMNPEQNFVGGACGDQSGSGCGCGGSNEYSMTSPMSQNYSVVGGNLLSETSPLDGNQLSLDNITGGKRKIYKGSDDSDSDEEDEDDDDWDDSDSDSDEEDEEEDDDDWDDDEDEMYGGSSSDEFKRPMSSDNELLFDRRTYYPDGGVYNDSTSEHYRSFRNRN